MEYLQSSEQIILPPKQAPNLFPTEGAHFGPLYLYQSSSWYLLPDHITEDNCKMKSATTDVLKVQTGNEFQELSPGQ